MAGDQVRDVTTNGQLSALGDDSRGRVRSAHLNLVGAYVQADGLAYLPALAWLAVGRGR